MIVVADTSALVALSYCKSLFLLDKLFGNVYVTESVYNESIVIDKSQSKELQKYLSDKIEPINKKQFLNLPSNLGKGEISAMLLYKKLNADYLLIDDNRARKIAAFNEINVIGSVGVLLLAKEHKFIKKITPYLDKLKKSKLYISEKLLDEVKKIAGE